MLMARLGRPVTKLQITDAEHAELNACMRVHHLIMDNYGTHKTEKIRALLAAHPRHQAHFTPTSASWLNLVGRFFSQPPRFPGRFNQEYLSLFVRHHTSVQSLTTSGL